MSNARGWKPLNEAPCPPEGGRLPKSGHRSRARGDEASNEINHHEPL
ncbi:MULTISPECIES: hypothetical protein [Thermoprotei]